MAEDGNWFKCSFCKKYASKNYLRCVDQAYGSATYAWACDYGTFLSIWKWFVRLSAYLGITIVLSIFVTAIGYLVKCIVHKNFTDIFFALLGVLTGIFIVGLIVIFVSINERFRDSNGKYFGK